MSKNIKNATIVKVDTATKAGLALGKLTEKSSVVAGKIVKETAGIVSDVAETGTEVLSAGKSIVRSATSSVAKGAGFLANQAAKMENAIESYDPNAPAKKSDKPGFLANLKAGFLAGFNS